MSASHSSEKDLGSGLDEAGGAKRRIITPGGNRNAVAQPVAFCCANTKFEISHSLTYPHITNNSRKLKLTFSPPWTRIILNRKTIQTASTIMSS